jgi:hypothetical protein
MKELALSLLKSKRTWVVAIAFLASLAAKHGFNLSPDVQSQLVDLITGSAGLLVVVTKLIDENKAK